MIKKYRVKIKDGNRFGYLEVYSYFAFSAWVKVLWWKLTGNSHYKMWPHWPLSDERSVHQAYVDSKKNR